MTTPGGVPNLPAGALTLDTLAAKTQDMSGDAMKTRAVERFPSIFNTSTGLNPALDITPFGILTRIWAEVNSLIANADPNDIQGPEDLPELVLEFIEGLPVVGQFVDILEAILGTYDGEAEVLLAVQEIFAPIRKLMQLVSGIASGDFPTLDELTEGWASVLPPPLQSLVDSFFNAFDSGIPNNTTGNPVDSVFTAAMGIIGFGKQAQAQNAIQDQSINSLLNPGTVGGGDDFTGTNGDPPDPAKWTVVYTGGTLGDIELNGSGALTWIENGSTPRLAQLQWLTPLTTQKCLSSVVLMANVPNGIIDPYAAVTACGSSDNSTRLEARIYNGSIEIGYVISGTYTVFGSPLTTSVNKGGAWSLKVDPATRKIDLLHDNAIAHTVTDSGGLAQFDMVGINDYTANLWSGCGHYCGNSFFPFTFVLVQLSAPDFGSFVTYEIV